jgi:Beta-lactamase
MCLSPGDGEKLATAQATVTAMALTKILHDAGVSADDVITPYLPVYWGPGSGADQITFADLMTMTSGLGPALGVLETYTAARENVVAGVLNTTDIGNAYVYLNGNFTLCRILMATVSGAIDTTYTYEGPPLPASSGPAGAPEPPGHHLTELEANDDIWDQGTIAFYEQYVQENILAPAGVTATLSRPAQCALAYTLPPVTAAGWNSGDRSEYAGPAGWHMSVDDLLTVMGTFRRAGAIMPQDAAQAMLDAHYGIDWQHGPQNSAAGNIYPKNGDDHRNQQTEQSGAVFFPLDMECVVFVNSPSATDLLNLMTDSFVSNLVGEEPHLGGPPGL